MTEHKDDYGTFVAECPQPDCFVEFEERSELTVRSDLRNHLQADHGYGAWGADRVLSGVIIYANS